MNVQPLTKQRRQDGYRVAALKSSRGVTSYALVPENVPCVFFAFLAKFRCKRMSKPFSSLESTEIFAGQTVSMIDKNRERT